MADKPAPKKGIEPIRYLHGPPPKPKAAPVAPPPPKAPEKPVEKPHVEKKK